MIEVTTTYTRRNTNAEFFAFQTADLLLLASHTNFRNEMTNSPGFIGLSYFMSEDKLSLRVLALWESEKTLHNFSQKTKSRDAFLDSLKVYNTKNHVTSTMSVENVFDPKYLKDKKLSTRLTVKEAQDRLVDFLSNQ
jgi:heme-degrading monooxygenase HmoA